MAIGAISTAVAVLLINIVSRDVAIYNPASMAVGPAEPRLSANVCETADDTPVFWSAVDKGIIAAMSTMLSQLMV